MNSEAPGRPRWVVITASIGVVGVLFAGLAGLWVARKINPSGSTGPTKFITIPTGASPASIGSLLEAEQIISDAQVFRWFVRLKGGASFKAGRYEMATNSDMGTVVDLLERAPQVQSKRLTIPEGLTLVETSQRMSKVPWLSPERFSALVQSGAVRSRWAPQSVTSLEGLLFPDTYQVDENEDEAELLTRMISTFDQVATELGYDQAQSRTGKSPYEVMVVASLVEAEAKADVDRAKIAQVIYNRLEKGMTLGIDATVYYALGRKGGSLTRSDLAVDSPYNTRKVKGLPPTPIALPGRASLEAALNPEPGPWLYYVLANKNGEHTFSESYDEFLKNKAAADRNGLL